MRDTTIQRSRPLEAGESELFLAGGCFWGTQQYLKQLAGVRYTDVGYANGETKDPTYEQVCSHTTGFAEAVRVAYNRAALPLEALIRAYFDSVDPTSLNRQGNDIGDQYRTGIYYAEPSDAPVVKAELAALAARLERPVVIESGPIESYYLAEEHHQDYLAKNPGGYCHISPAQLERAQRQKSYEKPADAALRERLTPLQYSVTQNAATEPPFTNEYCDVFSPGIYVDVTTGQPLFSSRDKFESGCGWPAFAKPLFERDIEPRADDSLGMRRVETLARHSRAHLGHVFPDGPPERGGQRYCINSAALRFIPKSEMQREGYGYLLGEVE